MLTLWQKLFAMILTFGLAFTIPLSADVAQVNTTRLSVPSSEANARSYSSSISEAGRYVAFRSYASNLVREDTNGLDDIFVHDNQTGTSMRVSLATDGTEANAGSSNPAISDDGRYVAFHSDASNLVSGDTNNVTDVLLHDLQTATTSRISLATAGTEGNGSSFSPDISDDGRYVAFYSLATNLVSGDNNNQTDVFIHDTQTSTTTRVSRATNGTEGNGGSGYPAISGNGRYVAFHSEASNLVTGDTNGVHDVFVHDTQTSTTTRVSEDTAGTQGNDDSFFAAISADGRYVAFYSEASNLVSGDTNGVDDVFVHDTQTGATVRVSEATAGAQGNGSSRLPAISDDGRYVGFESDATNLVGGDINGQIDVFVHDAQTGTTSRVSLSTAGTQGDGLSGYSAISGNGRHVAFESNATNLVVNDNNDSRDIFFHDTILGTTDRVSLASTGTEGNDDSQAAAISEHGRYVAFHSDAANLASMDTNRSRDIFLRDTQTSTTSRVSLSLTGGEGNDDSHWPAISADGRFVAFSSKASNLAVNDTNGESDIFVHDTQSSTTTRVSETSDGSEANDGSSDPAISGDGRYVAFWSWASNLVISDTNAVADVFVHDIQSGATTRVSLATDGTEGNGGSYQPAISADGRYVAFWSWATNLVSGDTNGERDVFVHDTQSGTTTRVSLATNGTQGNGESRFPTLSAQGRFVAFRSWASNLVNGDTNEAYDVFLHDTQTGTTTRVSLATDGLQGNDASYDPSISDDGRYVAFHSEASNLVSGDTNGSRDIFVRDTQTSMTTRVSLATDGKEGNGSSSYPNISADGLFVVFDSYSSNLVIGDTNGSIDIFLVEASTVSTEIYLPMVARNGP